MKNRLAIILVIIALLLGLTIAALLALLIVRRGGGTRFTNTPSVVMQIQSLSELVTVKYVLEKVIPAEVPATNIIDNFSVIARFRDDKIILLAHGVVKAGVDLSKIRAEDVQVSNGKISLQIPPATVTDAYLDEEHTQVLDRQTGLLRRFDKNLEREARKNALFEIQRGARQAGIEREANERAREQLKKLLKSLGYQEVEIRTRAGK